MHTLTTSFVLGYHGCDRQVAERILAGEPFKPSQNEYDWLGSGVYFWESNPRRGFEWALHLQKRHPEKITTPYVIGAVIDLGYCLDLSTSNGTLAVKAAYHSFCSFVQEAGRSMPQNRGTDLLVRTLDCAVVNHLHHLQEDPGNTGSRRFDSVRGIFIEGGPIYPTSAFNEKTHVQICIRSLENIKAAFRVPEDQWRKAFSE